MSCGVENFKKKLLRHIDGDVELIINENRSTMLHVIAKRRRATKLSLHKMFLDAPDPVISAIACYVRGTARKPTDQLIRGYIQTNLMRFNYSDQIKEEALTTQGEVYDLKEIFESINEEYFEGALDLKISWYGRGGRKSRHRVTFGQYVDQLRLIKMHRILDDAFFPKYFVRFVMYHEMLHHIVPGYLDEKGFYRIHGAEFKKREREFKEYKLAHGWEKSNREHFFRR